MAEHCRQYCDAVSQWLAEPVLSRYRCITFQGFLLRYAWACAPNNTDLFAMRQEFAKLVMEHLVKVDKECTGEKVLDFAAYDGLESAVRVMHQNKSFETSILKLTPTKEKTKAKPKGKGKSKDKSANSKSGNDSDQE